MFDISTIFQKIMDPGFIDKAVASPLDPMELMKAAGQVTGMGDLTASQDMNVPGVTWGGMKPQANAPSPFDFANPDAQTVNLRNSQQTIPQNQVSANGPPPPGMDWTKMAAALKADQLMKQQKPQQLPVPDASTPSQSGGKAATYKPYSATKPAAKNRPSLGSLLYGK